MTPPNPYLTLFISYLKIDLYLQIFVIAALGFAPALHEKTTTLLLGIFLGLGISFVYECIFMYRQSNNTAPLRADLFVISRFIQAIAWFNLSIFALPKSGIDQTSIMLLISTLLLSITGNTVLYVFYELSMNNASNSKQKKTHKSFILSITYTLTLLLPIAISISQNLRYEFLVLAVTLYSVALTYHIKNVFAIHLNSQKIIVKQSDFQKIEQLAYYDSITHLPNKTKLKKLVTDMLPSHPNNMKLATLAIHVDRLEYINDSLGNASGNLVLYEIASLLEKEKKSNWLIARDTESDFIILLSNLKSDEEALLVANHLLELVRKPISVKNHVLCCTVSIGIYVTSTETEHFDTLLNRANTALNKAKQEGGNQTKIYQKMMSTLANERLQIESSLRDSLVNEGFELYYQPQINLRSRKLVGVEALLRFKHPPMCYLSPAEFIPIAEETGLAIQIGRWILNEACRQIQLWKIEGTHVHRVAINWSATQYMQDDIISMLKSKITEYQIDPHQLELEVTESILIKNISHMQNIIRELQAMHINISIDDFGTGYSSLAYLKDFAVNKLKIDRSFLQNASAGHEHKAIIKAIVDMARTMQLNILAEGIETEEQHTLLLEQGCHEGQGWLYSPALSVQKLSTWISKHTKTMHST